MNLPVIVVGGGGHAKVLVSTLLLQHRRFLGFVDPKPSLPPLLGIAHLGDDDASFSSFAGPCATGKWRGLDRLDRSAPGQSMKGSARSNIFSRP